MELSVNIQYYEKNVGMEKAAKIVSDAGIKLLDYTPSPNADKSEWNKTLEIFNKNGLKVHQCHAPFNRYGQYGEQHKQLLSNSLDMAVFFGAKYLAVHGDEFDFNNKKFSPEAALTYNYEYFAPTVELAAKNKIYVAFENVFEDNFGGNPRYCSEPDDLIKLIDKFNNRYVCCCWDFGHGAVQLGNKCDNGITKLGNRIRCTHVHDNAYDHDSHLVPFFGQIDWNKNMNAIKNTPCDVLSFELVYGNIPENAMPAHAEMLAKIGQTLNRLANGTVTNTDTAI